MAKTEERRPGTARKKAEAGGLEVFRVRDAAAVHALLKALMDRNVALQLGTPDGTNYTTTIWSVDAAKKRMSFSGSVLDPAVHRIVEAGEVSAVGYLDRVKLQFDVDAIVFVHGGSHGVLQSALPRELFRFQRRSAYRVRAIDRGAPTVFMRHPQIPDMELALRVLDLSIGGCALFVPDDVPPLMPGTDVAGIRVELDAATGFAASLALRHVTSIQPSAGGVRLGCEWLRLEPEVERLLQRHIDQTQKRRRLLSLE